MAMTAAKKEPNQESATNAPPDEVRQWYKEAVACVKKLDESQPTSFNRIDHLLTADVRAIRDRLIELCERLYLQKPVTYGRKAEDLVWKRCFYDSIQAWRQNKHNINHNTAASLYQLVLAAEGYYRLWALRLCNHFFAPSQPCCFVEEISMDTANANAQLDGDVRQVVMRSIHRCFTWMGDLNRYLIDLYPDSADMEFLRSTAEYYYVLALRFNPALGSAYNQLGTLVAHENNGLDSICYYLKCVISPDPFDSVGENIKLSCKQAGFPPNANDEPAACIAKTLIAFVDSVYYKPSAAEADRWTQHAGAVANGMTVLLQPPDPAAQQQLDVNLLEKCVCVLLIATKAAVEKSHACMPALSSLVVCVIMLLSKAVSEQLNSQLLLQHSREASASPPQEAINRGASATAAQRERTKPVKSKLAEKDGPILRRRRRGESMDEGEEGHPPTDSSASSSENDDVEELRSSGSSVDDLGEETYNTAAQLADLTVDSDQPVRASCSFGVLVLDGELTDLVRLYQLLLDAVNVYPTFIRTEQSVLAEILSYMSRVYHVCRPSAQRTAAAAAAAAEPPVADSLYQVLTRTELPPSSYVHTPCLAAVFASVGSVLRLMATLYPHVISHNAQAHSFQLLVGDANKPSEENRQSMMAKMGRLRTNAELERVSATGWLPVYVVPDYSALTNRLPQLQKLADSFKFVMVIAPKVLALLDRNKKDASTARDAIRWIERQASRGSKFVRSAKPNEHVVVQPVDDDQQQTLTDDTLDVLCVCAGLTAKAGGGQQQQQSVLVSILTDRRSDDPICQLLTDWTNSVQGVSLHQVGAFLSRWESQSQRQSRGGRR